MSREGRGGKYGSNGYESGGSQKGLSGKIGKTTAKVPHNFNPLSGLLSVPQVAEKLGKSPDTITRWCKSGKLPALSESFGKRTTYKVSLNSVQWIQQALKELEEEKHQKQSCSKSSKAHAEYFDGWVLAMEKGLITGKPFSPVSVRDYSAKVRYFFKSQSTVSFKALETELLNVPTEQYCKRFMLYKSVVCFAKHLIRQGVMDKLFLSEVKPLFPKRHKPPKRPGLDEAQVKQLIEAATKPFNKMMVSLLLGTGLRVSEAVSLKRNDIDFERQVLTVRKGKGNKIRKLGLNGELLRVIQQYFDTVDSGWVFSDKQGKPISRTSLAHRLKRLGNKVDISVSPHALRRTFVTLNANKGRPLQMLQIACGHSDIKTTRNYCLTSEQEVIDAMKEWN